MTGKLTIAVIAVVVTWPLSVAAFWVDGLRPLAVLAIALSVVYAVSSGVLRARCLEDPVAQHESGVAGGPPALATPDDLTEFEREFAEDDAARRTQLTEGET